MNLTLVALLDRNGALGAKGVLPALSPEAREHYEQRLDENFLLVGRVTYEQQLVRPQGRELLVFSRGKSTLPRECIRISSVGHLLTAYMKNAPDVVLVVGGISTYTALIPYIGALELFVSDEAMLSPDGWLPHLTLNDWIVKQRVSHPACTQLTIERTQAVLTEGVEEPATFWGRAISTWKQG
jgi:dihydrofolate reductase